ncbi:hypothetical protein DFH27DRAFT_583200 [Peziza echinospora]|nr:hypothetical protein DFH27DRAFT_583200 [Peziza echinospora]
MFPRENGDDDFGSGRLPHHGRQLPYIPAPPHLAEFLQLQPTSLAQLTTTALDTLARTLPDGGQLAIANVSYLEYLQWCQARDTHDVAARSDLVEYHEAVGMHFAETSQACTTPLHSMGSRYTAIGNCYWNRHQYRCHTQTPFESSHPIDGGKHAQNRKYFVCGRRRGNHTRMNKDSKRTVGNWTTALTGPKYQMSIDHSPPTLDTAWNLKDMHVLIVSHGGRYGMQGQR